MTRQLQEIFDGLGLSRREMQIYLAVLQNPEINIAGVARHTAIPRMTCYATTEELVRKGFLDILVKRGRRYFVAVPPRKIFERVSRRAAEFGEALPAIEAYEHHTQARAKVRFFEGVEGIRAVFRRLLDEKRPFAAITCIDDMEAVAKDYFHDFIERRVRQHLPVRLLTNRSPASLRLKTRDHQELRQTRFVPERYRFHTAHYVSGDVIAMLSLKHQPPTALVIEDAELARTHAMYFDLIWTMVGTQ